MSCTLLLDTAFSSLVTSRCWNELLTQCAWWANKSLGPLGDRFPDCTTSTQADPQPWAHIYLWQGKDPAPADRRLHCRHWLSLPRKEGDVELAGKGHLLWLYSCWNMANDGGFVLDQLSAHQTPPSPFWARHSLQVYLSLSWKSGHGSLPPPVPAGLDSRTNAKSCQQQTWILWGKEGRDSDWFFDMDIHICQPQKLNLGAIIKRKYKNQIQ